MTADALERLAQFCRQTATDGVLPSLAWFTEAADSLDSHAALVRAGGVERTPGKDVQLPYPRDYWKCFHCGEVFVTEEQAVKHFGPRDPANPLHARNETDVKAAHRQWLDGPHPAQSAEPPAQEPRPPDRYPWGEAMAQYATLGIGAEAWVELQKIEQDGIRQRNNDLSGMSISWRTFKLVMVVLRAIRIEDFREARSARPNPPPATSQELDRLYQLADLWIGQPFPFVTFGRELRAELDKIAVVPHDR